MTGSTIEFHSSDQKIIEAILSSEKYVVYPNKYLQAPVLDLDSINSIFQEKSLEIQIVLDRLLRYLLGIAAGDHFGSDHSARRKYLNELHQKYGLVYFDGIESRNKFRANKMAIIIPNIRRIANYATKFNHPQLAEQLSNIIEQSISKLNKFPDYNRISSLDTKYEIVCILDDAIVSVFETIASYYQTQTNLTN